MQTGKQNDEILLLDYNDSQKKLVSDIKGDSIEVARFDNQMLGWFMPFGSRTNINIEGHLYYITALQKYVQKFYKDLEILDRLAHKKVPAGNLAELIKAQNKPIHQKGTMEDPSEYTKEDA